MNRLWIVVVALLTGCANPYARFYQGQPDARKLPSYQPSGEELHVYSSNDLDKDIVSLERGGFIVIGSSSFNAGANAVHEWQLKEQAKKIGAQVVLVSSKYTHTVQGAAPLVMPQNTTSYTTGHATAYGPGGVTNITGNATTTTYGTQTMMMPYAIQRSDFAAVYFTKVKLRLGIFVLELDDQTRQRLQTNKGVKVRNVAEDSPAFDADILPGDVVLMIGNEQPSSPQQFASSLDKYQGKSVHIKLDRNGTTVEKDVRIRTYE